MYLVGAILKHHPGYYLDECIVGHTQGNLVHWEYSGDYMFSTKLRMYNELLPGETWKLARTALTRRLLEEVVCAHIPHAFSQSVAKGLGHQLAIIRNRDVSFSAHYWVTLIRRILLFAKKRLDRIRRGKATFR